MTYEPRRVVGASQNGRSLEEIRFGALVIIRQGLIQSEHLFLGWNEDETKLWLARESAGPMKRGPLTRMIDQEVVVSFQNVERYEPLREDVGDRNSHVVDQRFCPTCGADGENGATLYDNGLCSECEDK